MLAQKARGETSVKKRIKKIRSATTSVETFSALQRSAVQGVNGTFILYSPSLKSKC